MTQIVIDEAIATYRDLGVRSRWLVAPHTRPVDLGERLARRGFEAVPLRAMGITTTAPVQATARGISVEAIDASSVDAFVRTMARGWGMAVDQLDEEVHVHESVLARVPRVVHFLGAKVDGQWAGTAALMLRDGYGFLMGGQVLESARCRGVYRALVAARLACLHARGFEYAVTNAHEATSAPILEHLRFETLFHATSWSLTP